MIDLCVTSLSSAPEGHLWPHSAPLAICEQTGTVKYPAKSISLSRMTNLAMSPSGVPLTNATQEFEKFQLPHLDDSNDIPASMFRLTEWVCRLLQTQHSGGQSSDQQLLKCYEKCLSWYDEFLTFAKNEQSPAPFILFVQ